MENADDQLVKLPPPPKFGEEVVKFRVRSELLTVGPTGSDPKTTNHTPLPIAGVLVGVDGNPIATNFFVNRNEGTSVTLSAPLSHNGATFRFWRMNDNVFFSEDENALTLQMLHDATFTAVYKSDFTPGVSGTEFIRGDSNSSGRVDLADAVLILGALFKGNGEIACDDAADANDDGRINLADAVSLLNFLFRGGPPPAGAAPQEPQVDQTEDSLGCASASSAPAEPVNDPNGDPKPPEPAPEPPTDKPPARQYRRRRRRGSMPPHRSPPRTSRRRRRSSHKNLNQRPIPT